MTTGAEVIAGRIAKAGVTVLFGVMGDGNLGIIDGFMSLGGHHVAARHELGAVAMADGYARATNRVGVATCTIGPGFTNGLTAMINARKARSPVVIVSGDVPTDPDLVRSFLRVQEVDQTALAGWAGIESIRAKIESLAEDVAEALRRSLDTSAPVALFVPKDVLLADVETGDLVDRPRPAPVAKGPEETRLRKAVGIINSSSKPVILAGRGAALAGAGRDLVTLSERIPALLGTTLRAKDMFRGVPGNLDIVGGYSSTPTRHLLAQTDCLIAVGASLNDHTTMEDRLIPSGASIIQCDSDESAMRSGDNHVHMPADARAAAIALLAAIPPRDNGAASGWVSAGRDELGAHDRHSEYPSSHTERGLDPRWLAMALDEILPQRILVLDSGHFSGFGNVYMHVGSPFDHLFAHDFGAVGLGLGTAIGAALARPAELVALVVGDGGLMMSLQDLDTARRERLNLAVFVMNDGGYGAEAHRLRLKGHDPGPALFANPPFTTLANAMGIRSMLLQAPDDIQELPGFLEQDNMPVLIECLVDPLVRSRTMEDLYRAERSQNGRSKGTA